MNRSWRWIIWVASGALGVAAALGVVVWSTPADPAGVAHVPPELAAALAPPSLAAIVPDRGSARRSEDEALSARTNLTAPSLKRPPAALVAEVPQPRFGQQVDAPAAAEEPAAPQDPARTSPAVPSSLDPAAAWSSLHELLERVRQQAQQEAGGAGASPPAFPVDPPLPGANPSQNGQEQAGATAAPSSPSAPERSGAEIVPAPRSRIAPAASGEGDDRLQVHIRDEDIRVVLAMLSEAGGLNILPSKNVQGSVSASLNEVTIDRALEAILRSTGYVARREGNFIYVGTPLDFQAMDHALDTISTRLYRPNYVPARELEALITPLLTPGGVGVVKASTPAQTRIAPNADDAEGNNFAGQDALLVQDYEAVLTMIDQVVAEIDQPPVQVAIESMILSVRLDDQHSLGVDFDFLRNKNHLKSASGSPMQDLAQVTFNGGLKFAYLDGSLGSFLHALETIGDTDVIATPRLMVLNKHRAEILIGSKLGYVSTSQTETSTTQNVEFLEVGAQLRLRPFVSNDGIIRMEIHPELSTGAVRIEGGFTLPDKEVTQVTTNVMVRDGHTLVLGGLMREDLVTTANQVPVAGNLPLVGWLFRSKTERLEKREILVLVTPRIVHEPGMYLEGEQGATEFHRRHQVFADKMSPLGKRNLGRKYFRLAQEAWQRGEREAALRLVSLAIHIDPLNRAAIDLRSDIWAGRQTGDHSGAAPLPQEVLDGPAISPWLLEELEHAPVGPPSPAPPAPVGRRIEPMRRSS